MNKTSSQQPALTSQEAQTTAESIVGPIKWQDAEHGFCHCPGTRLHEHRNGERHCRVSLDKVPTIHCVHTSCAGMVETANRALRSALGKRVRGGALHQPTAIELAERAGRLADREAAKRLRTNARASRQEILRQWEWSEVEAWEASPLRLEGPPEDDWRFHLALFPADAVVWIGNERDTGRAEHAQHFRRVSDWLRGISPIGHFCCGSTFLEGSFSRCSGNVTGTPFLIVEGDAVDPICAIKKARADARKAEGLPHDPANEFSAEDKERNRVACLAIIRWLREAVELRLVAIVDAGNKSAHGWFELPPPPVVAELRTILPDLGCDTAMLMPSQPARLAGVKRADRWQRLLFCEIPKWKESR